MATKNWEKEKQRTAPQRYGALSRRWFRDHPGAQHFPYTTREERAASAARQKTRDAAPRYDRRGAPLEAA